MYEERIATERRPTTRANGDSAPSRSSCQTHQTLHLVKGDPTTAGCGQPVRLRSSRSPRDVAAFEPFIIPACGSEPVRSRLRHSPCMGRVFKTPRQDLANVAAVVCGQKTRVRASCSPRETAVAEPLAVTSNGSEPSRSRRSRTPRVDGFPEAPRLVAVDASTAASSQTARSRRIRSPREASVTEPSAVDRSGSEPARLRPPSSPRMAGEQHTDNTAAAGDGRSSRSVQSGAMVEPLAAAGNKQGVSRPRQSIHGMGVPQSPRPDSSIANGCGPGFLQHSCSLKAAAVHQSAQLFAEDATCGSEPTVARLPLGPCATSTAAPLAKGCASGRCDLDLCSTERPPPKVEAVHRRESSRPPRPTATPRSHFEDGFRLPIIGLDAHEASASLAVVGGSTGNGCASDSTLSGPPNVGASLIESPWEPVGRQVRLDAAARLVRQRETLENVELVLRSKNLSKQDMMREFLQMHRIDASHNVFLLVGPDDHIRSALKRREPSWLENRIGDSKLWNLKWCATDCEEDYRLLDEADFYNHFQNNHVLTTKVGLASSLRQFAVDELVDIDDFFPRCYDMSSTSERDDFILDFRRSAALKVVEQHRRLALRTAYHVDSDVIRLALRVLWRWIADLDGTHIDDEVDAVVPAQLPIGDDEWNALVTYSEISDVQFVGQQGEVSRCRRSSLRFRASGSAVVACERSPERRPDPRASARPTNVREWVEFCGHVWLTKLGQDLEVSIEECLKAIAVRMVQLAAQGPVNAWIVKAGTSSKGNGICCLQSLPDILHHCSVMTNRVVQKYVERPLLLFSGRKFDIRQWVFVRSIEPLEAFMFSDCYLRLCNEPFDLGDLGNRLRHLSNWSVNKHGRHAQEGAVASLDTFRAELAEITGRDDCWEILLVPKIRHIILSCLQAVKSSMVHRVGCFELYGFDLLIDEDLKPWLLEVNLSPACEARTPWLAAMLERMSMRLLEIVFDKKEEGDGRQPDWVRITSAARPSGAGESLAKMDLDAIVTKPLRGYVGDLTLQGRPLNVRAERSLEDAWRRRAAQALILRVARGFLARRTAQYLRRGLAGERLAAAWRRHVGRQAAKKRGCLSARSVLVCHARRFLALARLQHCQWTGCACAVQRKWRGVLGRRRAESVRRGRAAMQVQRCFRGRMARKRLAAQLKVLRWWRVAHRSRCSSATRIQAVVRGWSRRRKYAQLCIHVWLPVTRLAMVVAMVRWRRQASLCVAHGAARAVQRQWRRRVAESRARSFRLLFDFLKAWQVHVRNAILAARVMQSVWRGHMGRRWAKLQRVTQRNEADALEARSRIIAATQIQSAARSMAVRQALSKRHTALCVASAARVSAVRIQSTWRMALVRGRVGCLRNSARARQAAARCMVVVAPTPPSNEARLPSLAAQSEDVALSSLLADTCALLASAGGGVTPLAASRQYVKHVTRPTTLPPRGGLSTSRSAWRARAARACAGARAQEPLLQLPLHFLRGQCLEELLLAPQLPRP